MNKGDLIQDRYRLVAPLGSGGMGDVWTALDTRLDRLVAVKFLSDAFRDDPENLVRFFSEAQSIARIQHPNVVTVLDFGDASGTPYLVMEYVAGGPLTDLCGEPLLPERALDIIAAAAAGAGAAHALGIVHRDIKPGNILLDEDGVPHLADFGIASSGAPERMTQSGLAIGSPHYLSPEQAQGRTAVPASDVYSLGVVLYEMLTGVKPFDGSNITAVAIAHVDRDPAPPSELVPDLPPDIDTLVLRCLAKDPEARFSDGAELAAAIESGDWSSDRWAAPVTESHADEGLDRPSHLAMAAGAAVVVFVLGLMALMLFGGNGGERAVAEEEESRSPARRRPAPTASATPTPTLAPVAAEEPSEVVTTDESEATTDAKKKKTGRDRKKGDTKKPEPEPTPTAEPEPTPTPEPEPTPTPDEPAP